MTIERILVVAKKPRRVPAPSRRGPPGRGPNPHRALVLRARAEHRETLALVRTEIEKTGIPHRFLLLPPALRPGPRDLVVTVGGDGTLLFASHFVRDAPVLGVNSSPSTSLGVLCGASVRDFGRKLAAALDGRLRGAALARLSIAVEGGRGGAPALNDCLVTADNPAVTFRYEIEAGGKREMQRSSGLWVSTATGSTGGIRSAGGRILPLRSRRLQFLVREPCPDPRAPFRLMRGILPPGAKLSVTSLVPSAHVYVDGPRRSLKLGYGEAVRIGTDAPPLVLLGLDEAMRRRL